MKKSYRVVSVLCVLSLLFAALPLLTSCSKKDYDFWIVNAKGESAKPFEELAELYKKETGKVMKVQSVQSGQGANVLLKSLLNSNEQPTIFPVEGLSELKEWIGAGKAYDLNSEDADSKFKEMARNIPENYRISTDGKGNYGIPYNLEGYGLAVNKDVLSSLFGADKVDDFISDFKTATYEEFEAAVKVLKEYIDNGTAGAVNLSGNAYSLADQKDETSNKLKGVFSVAGKEAWTYGNHLLNIALNTHFTNQAEAYNAKEDQINSCVGAFKAYAKVLDLMSSNANIARNKNFVNNDYNHAVIDFAQGKTLFIKQGNWISDPVKKANPGAESKLVLLPLKLDVKEEDISVEGMTPEKFNASIPVFVPWYHIVNAKASKSEIKCAQDFFVWLNTSEKGRDFMINKLHFIPFDIKENEVSKVSDALGKSVISYHHEGNVMGNPYVGLGDAYTNKTVGVYFMEKWLNKETWNAPSDYEVIAGDLVKSWIDFIGKRN